MGPKSRFSLLQFLMRAFFLACRWLPFTMSLYSDVNSGVSYYKHTNPMRYKPHPLTSLNFNYLLIGPISKYSYIEE